MCGKCTCLISKIFFDYKLGNTNLIINIFIKEAFMKRVLAILFFVPFVMALAPPCHAAGKAKLRYPW